jgi:hypothetical protein
MKNKKRVRSFEDLMVWQIGIELVKQIYVLTASGALNKTLASGINFALHSQ